MFLCTFFIGSLIASSARFREFDVRNMILFQFKIFGRNIIEIALARYFIKVTARPCFTRLRIIRQIIEFIKYKDRTYVTKIQLDLLI